MKHVISTTTAPGAVGPYSQAIEANGFVFVSGSFRWTRRPGAFVPGGTSEQAEQSIKNLLAVLEAAGCKAEDVVKDDRVYDRYRRFRRCQRGVRQVFLRRVPRALCDAGGRPAKGALVEIEAIAVKP